MHLESDTTIPTAIRHYAICLNRRGWLDPDLLEDQRKTWLMLVNLYGGRRDGVVTGDDLFQAIQPTGRDDKSRDRLPPDIIHEAVTTAASRALRARRILDNTPDMTLADLRAVLSSMQRSARSPAELQTARRAFLEGVAHMIGTLERSGYDRSEIDPVIERINAEAEVVATRAAEVAAHVSPRPVTA